MAIGLPDGELIVQCTDATPNPNGQVRESLPDGAEFRAVWSHLPQRDVAKRVTNNVGDFGRIQGIQIDNWLA